MAGETLVRVAPFDRSRTAQYGFGALSGMHARAANATGVHVDHESTLWLSGGDRLNRLSLNGRLIESAPLLPAGSRVTGQTFAEVHGALYFLGRLPKGQPALFALPLRPRPGPPRAACALEKVVLPQPARSLILVDHPIQGSPALVYEPKDAPGATVVEILNPETGERRLFAELDCDTPMGATLNDRGELFIGARFKQLLSMSAGHNTVSGIIALDSSGKPLPRFPISATFRGPSAIQFRGDLCFADGALWELAWHGTLSRLDRQAKAAPGNLRTGGPAYDVDYASQLATVAPGFLAITSGSYDSVHLMRNDGSPDVTFVRRIGCLPEVSSLGLSPEGWVVAGTPRGLRWWQWNDPPDAPARKSEFYVVPTPGVFSGDRFLTLAGHAGLPRPVPAVFEPDIAAVVGFWDRHQVPIAEQCVPMTKPVGFSVAPMQDKPLTDAWIADAKSCQLHRSPFDWRSFRLTRREWTAVAVTPPLTAVSDVIALAGGNLLVSDAGAVVLLTPAGDGLQQRWRWNSWGDGPGDRFGKSIRIAAQGSHLAVSDTDRHRVLLADWSAKKILAQFGRTDRAGADVDELNAPTVIAGSGNRAIVFDSGNQRLIKLVVSP